MHVFNSKMLLSGRISHLFATTAKIVRRVKLQPWSHPQTFCTTHKTFEEFSVSDKKIEKYLEKVRLEFYGLQVSDNLNQVGRKRMRLLSHLVELVEQRKVLMNNLDSLSDLKDEKDPDMIELMKEEIEVYNQMLLRLDADIKEEIVDMDEDEHFDAFMLEVTAAVGGQEAMLFARELFDMYTNYCEFKGWDNELLHLDNTDVGGIRQGSILVTADDAYRHLKHEGGVHRVQRVPATEKSGRIHTSTVTVAIIPRPDDLDININAKDLKIETKRAGGAGGQHVNTTDSAVRIVHLPTGVAVECQTERSQIQNRAIAIQKLKAKLIQTHVDKQTSDVVSTRKSQVGTSNRNEKIRTYNYNQDRITDHRIENGTKHNLKGFLSGGQDLDNLISRLNKSFRKRQLMELISKMEDVKS